MDLWTRNRKFILVSGAEGRVKRERRRRTSGSAGGASVVIARGLGGAKFDSADWIGLGLELCLLRIALRSVGRSLSICLV